VYQTELVVEGPPQEVLGSPAATVAPTVVPLSVLGRVPMGCAFAISSFAGGVGVDGTLASVARGPLAREARSACPEASDAPTGSSARAEAADAPSRVAALTTSARELMREGSARRGWRS
jgi:hypothetical protein